MATTNQGGQNIVYRYRTPLQAKVLATALGHITNGGLIDINATISGTSLTVSKFSMIVKASKYVSGTEELEPNIDVDDTMFKVTGNTPITFSGLGSGNFDTNCLILTFDYSFTGRKEGVPALMDSWFGEFNLLSSKLFFDKVVSNVGESQECLDGASYSINDTFDSYILGAVLKQSDGTYIFTTNGADWAGLALEEKGFDPKFWLSLSSPKRHCTKTKVGDTFVYDNTFDDYLEVRKFNDKFYDYFPREFASDITIKDFKLKVNNTKHQNTGHKTLFNESVTRFFSIISGSLCEVESVTAGPLSMNDYFNYACNNVGTVLGYVDVASGVTTIQNMQIKPIIYPNITQKVCKLTSSIYASITKDSNTVYIVTD